MEYVVKANGKRMRLYVADDEDLLEEIAELMKKNHMKINDIVLVNKIEGE